jgi:hypothetical protein
VGSGYGPSFRLSAESLAIARGLATFGREDRDWVPAGDFKGDRRIGSAVDAGYDQAIRGQP